MTTSHTETRPFNTFPLWRESASRPLFAIDLEITARCNNACRHCYINRPPHDRHARSEEMSIQQIEAILDEALSLGTLWILLTGGEPLLREDFEEIYMRLKRKGFLVSVFTNATLITEDHIRLFTAYPPRDLEVTVYGVTCETYERVSRRKGSFDRFRRGLDLLWANNIHTNLKTTACQSNYAELPRIMDFCRKHGHGPFRFDPHLHLRFDGDKKRNKEIEGERLTPDEIAALERRDLKRMEAYENACRKQTDTASPSLPENLFSCGVGRNDCAVSPDGWFRLCPSLWHPDYIYDLKKGSLKDAWEVFTPRVLSRATIATPEPAPCFTCGIRPICMWCPAHACLESGKLDAHVPYFCDVARKREALLEKKAPSPLASHASQRQASRPDNTPRRDSDLRRNDTEKGGGRNDTKNSNPAMYSLTLSYQALPRHPFPC